MKRIIIAISRQYGSGGRLIGKALAEKLSIPCYDGNALAPDFHEGGELKKPVVDLMGDSSKDLKLAEAMEKRFMADVRNAAKSSCVIIGMSASYVLKDDPDLVSVFIKAPLEARIERAVKVYGLPKRKAERFINRMDMARASYYEFVSGLKWGMARNYNLTIDSSTTGIDGGVEAILAFLRNAGRID